MDKVLNKIRHIASQYNCITKVVLFGSRARGDNTDTSDYDIAVFSKNMQQSELLSFSDKLDEIETLNKIDVIFIKERHLDTELYSNILRDGVDIMNKYQTKLNNYTKALSRLHEALVEAQNNDNLIIRDGVIQRFEFTSELAWKVLREYLLSQEVSDINTPKNVMKEAYNNMLITNAEGWMQILKDRNSSSHIYDEEDSAEIYQRIATEHIVLFDALIENLPDDI